MRKESYANLSLEDAMVIAEIEKKLKKANELGERYIKVILSKYEHPDSVETCKAKWDGFWRE